MSNHRKIMSRLLKEARDRGDALAFVVEQFLASNVSLATLDAALKTYQGGARK